MTIPGIFTGYQIRFEFKLNGNAFIGARSTYLLNSYHLISFKMEKYHQFFLSNNYRVICLIYNSHFEPKIRKQHLFTRFADEIEIVLMAKKQQSIFNLTEGAIPILCYVLTLVFKLNFLFGFLSFISYFSSVFTIFFFEISDYFFHSSFLFFKSS